MLERALSPVSSNLALLLTGWVILKCISKFMGDLSKQTSTQPPPLHAHQLGGGSSHHFFSTGAVTPANLPICQSGYIAAEEHGTKNPISLTICVTTSPPPYPALDKAHGEASGAGCWESRPHWCEGPLLVSSAFWFQRSNQAKHISNTLVCADMSGMCKAPVFWSQKI